MTDNNEAGMSIQDPVVVYLHGFNSSPDSRKAQVLRDWVKVNRPELEVEVPALPYSPQAAAQLLDQLAHRLGARWVGCIGSSLGGYYATWLASRYQIPAALINPAVRPYELLTDYLGENTNLYTGERYLLTGHHMQELLDLDVAEITRPELFFLLLQTADETLDCRQAASKFAQARGWIEGGGNHEFSGFERTLPAVFEFFGY